MRRKYIFSALLILLGSCSKDDALSKVPTVAIGSSSFESALIHIGFDQDGKLNGLVASDAISQINYLPLSGQNITDLSGIGHFVGLKKLDVSNNQITRLDVSKNIYLKELDFSGNQVSNIDVRKNTALTSLVCFNNLLTRLDVGQNTALSTLACTNNKLTTLNVSQNIQLSQLYCSENQITNLDIGKNTKLEELFCFTNMLTDLDISKNPVLRELYCYDNQLKILNVKNGHNIILTKLNAENNANLRCIQVDDEVAANSGELPYKEWIQNGTGNYLENCPSN